MFKLSLLAKAAAVGAFALSGVAQANLVTNGGFETGNFSGWTQFGNTGFTSVACGAGVAQYRNSGNCGGIFQTLNTVAQGTYTVSFWLSIDSGTPNSMTFNWNGGGPELTITNAPGQSMQLYSYTLVATGATTDLRFNIQHNPAYYGLDDIVVRQVSAPGTLALAGLALLGVGVASRRQRAA
jgi:hypothetical protein